MLSVESPARAGSVAWITGTADHSCAIVAESKMAEIIFKTCSPGETCIVRAQEGVYLDARKNGQIAGSDVVLHRCDAGSTPQPTWLCVNHTARYYPRRSRIRQECRLIELNRVLQPTADS